MKEKKVPSTGPLWQTFWIEFFIRVNYSHCQENLKKCCRVNWIGISSRGEFLSLHVPETTRKNSCKMGHKTQTLATTWSLHVNSRKQCSGYQSFFNLQPNFPTSLRVKFKLFWIFPKRTGNVIYKKFINKIAESKPQNNNLGLAGVETSLTN